jgi:threonine synthase
MLTDGEEGRLKQNPGSFWRDLFDYRLLLNHQALRGVFTFHEFLAPLIPLEDIVFLGEAHTPLVRAPEDLEREIGSNFYVKLDGLNPSASFKDRGMAAALSYVKYLARTQKTGTIMALCASTGDTSAAAALYSASLGGIVKSAVLLPKGYVTPQQLSQPLGAGATVFELPGVFDDCMKVVEYLSDNYQVVLLNSKNPWRVLGQESYAYEVAQQFDYDLAGKVVFVPVGNAGNITAILSGFLKFYRAEVITTLPKIVAVQSERANPVFLYYQKPPDTRKYTPVKVKPSVAQAAMIGDPVSFPRLAKLAQEFSSLGGSFQVVEVKEEGIMEAMIQANRKGLTICTQGGEALAGLKVAKALGIVLDSEISIIDSTAHALKFMEFQNGYFAGSLAKDYGIESKREYLNSPQELDLGSIPRPSRDHTLTPEEHGVFVKEASLLIAKALGLHKN